MANSRAANVLRVDTTAAFTEIRNVRAIKFIGATAASSVFIRGNGATSGNLVWQHSGSGTATDPCLDILSGNGIHVTVAGSAVVYLYV